MYIYTHTYRCATKAPAKILQCGGPAVRNVGMSFKIKYHAMKCLGLGLLLRCGLRLECQCCQVASDVGRAMRATKSVAVGICVLGAPCTLGSESNQRSVHGGFFFFQTVVRVWSGELIFKLNLTSSLPLFYLNVTSNLPLCNLFLPQFNLRSAGNLEPRFWKPRFTNPLVKGVTGRNAIVAQ